MIKAIVSDESLGFFERPWDLCFQNKRKSSRCERQDRLWLNKVECLFPGPNHPGQEYQKKSVRLLVDGAFYLSPENHELVPQQRVFRKEFGCSSGQIGECAEHKGGLWRFHPAQKMFLQRMKAETDTLFDEGVYTEHELNLSFVKMGVVKSRMNLVSCTRLSQAAASKPVSSYAIYRFHERMPQVASTGSGSSRTKTNGSGR